MTNKDLIDKLAQRCSLSNERATELTKIVSDSICNYCSQLDAVAIPGFGTFIPEKNDESVVTDYSTGCRTLLPPSINVKFKASVVLRKKFVG